MENFLHFQHVHSVLNIRMYSLPRGQNVDQVNPLSFVSLSVELYIRPQNIREKPCPIMIIQASGVYNFSAGEYEVE